MCTNKKLSEKMRRIKSYRISKYEKSLRKLATKLILVLITMKKKSHNLQTEVQNTFVHASFAFKTLDIITNGMIQKNRISLIFILVF